MSETSLEIGLLELKRAQTRILETADAESCGFLVGWCRHGHCRVESFVFGTNLSDEPERFVISPREHRDLLRDLPANVSLLGIFHSHLGDPRPSPDDLETMRLHPSIWLIIGNVALRDAARLSWVAFRSSHDGIRALSVGLVPHGRSVDRSVARAKE